MTDNQKNGESSTDKALTDKASPAENAASAGKSRFNLSEWALNNQVLVLYLMIMLTVAGLLAYSKLGQSEDPPFTFKVMLVRTTWPGASAIEVEQQITDKLEKKLQEVPHLDHTNSYSRPGESMIFIIIKDDTFSKEVPEIWYQTRKKIADIRHTLPRDVESMVFNDEFSDVYGSMYALTGDGFDNFALKKQAEIIRSELLQTTDVAKVDFFGEQKQRIFIELSNAKLAAIGLNTSALLSILQAQNAVARGGTYESSTERIRVEDRKSVV